MFLQVSVILFTGGVRGPGGVRSGGLPGGDPLHDYCCGRYASYWNAFLLNHGSHFFRTDKIPGLFQYFFTQFFQYFLNVLFLFKLKTWSILANIT